jgi:hypothetical protein
MKRIEMKVMLSEFLLSNSKLWFLAKNTLRTVRHSRETEELLTPFLIRTNGVAVDVGQPSILLEAEERHRPGAVRSVRTLLESLGYEAYMLERGTLVSIRRFDPAVHQSAEAAEQRRLTGDLPVST